MTTDRIAPDRLAQMQRALRCSECHAPAVYRVVTAYGRDTGRLTCEHGAIALRGLVILERLKLADYI